MSIQVAILAAGKGKRMHSSLPKVLHQLAGRPLLEHVILTAAQVTPHVPPIIVCGHQGTKVKEVFSHFNVEWVLQNEQLGTGHALMQALPLLESLNQVLVLYGDVPLISAETLKKFIEQTPKECLGILTAHLEHSKGYGRIKRNAQKAVVQIIEEKEANQAEQEIKEINSGIYLIPVDDLKRWLPALSNNNQQKEYYLTDIIQKAVSENKKMVTYSVTPAEEVMGVNDHVQLAQLERFYQRQKAEKLMQQGVRLLDPNRFDVRGDMLVSRDVTIDVNCIFEGRVVLGEGCSIGPNCYLRNAVVGQEAEIKANSVIDGAEIAAHSIVGPFARLRPGTVLLPHVHVGNFVEIKNSTIGDCSKVNHLSYIGDSEVGKRVNIGAGTITCNYDGVNKHKTVIGDNAFIGSDTQLVAPVVIGAGAIIGAGSTIVKSVPPEQLTVTHRLEQRSLQEKRPKPDEKILV